MQKSFIFGLLLLIFLASAVSAQITDLKVVINNMPASYPSVPIMYIEDYSTIEVSFTSLVNAQDVIVSARLEGTQLISQTEPFNIVAGGNYSKVFSYYVPYGLSEEDRDIRIDIDSPSQISESEDFEVNLNHRIHFVSPTPEHGSVQSNPSIYVNLTTFVEDDNYVLLDFDKTNKLWMRMDDLDKDGNLIDLSSYANNGVKFGDAHQISDGAYNASFSFDGNADGIQIDHPVSTKNDNVSMVLFVNWAGNTGANQIIAYNGHSASSGFGIRLDKSEGNQLELLIGGVGWVETSETLPLNKWTQLATVRNNGKWFIYKDGSLISIVSGSTLKPNIPTDKFLIGINSVGNASFNGTIDEVFVFDRALSQKEVQALYDAGHYPYFNNFTNLQAGAHEFKAYTVGRSGNIYQTEKRTVFIGEAGAIPLYQCGILNQESREYTLMNDILTYETCFGIGANGITLDMNDFSIDGGTYGNEAGIMIEADEVTVKNGKISNFEIGIGAENSKYLAIQRMTLTNNEESGIFLDDISNSHISDSYIAFNEEGININGEGSNIIEDNIIKSSYRGLILERTSLNLIKDTTIANSMGSDFHVEGNLPEHCNNELTNITWTEGHPTEFYNHSVNLKHIKSHGLILCNADGSTLKDVNLINDKQMNSLSLILTDNAVLTNVVVDNTWDGLVIENGKNNVIKGIVSKNNRRHGLQIRESNNNKVSRSQFINNLRGIDISGNNNFLENNIIEYNAATGISLESESIENIIKSNTVKYNEVAGLSIGEGVFSSLIYNNFFNNANNVEFEEDVDYNEWNVTLSSGSNIIGGSYIGGNFWANPEGTGFSEVCKDGNDDGICDEPYLIAENNIDYFPLTY